MVIKFLIAATMMAAAGSAALAAPACEPARLAEKYPSLAGKIVKIGADPQTPPYVMRDPADFAKLQGVDVDLADAVLDCAGIKHEFFLGGWGGLIPATIGGQIDVFWDTLYYTPARAKQLDFVVYLQAATGAMTQAGNPKKINSVEGSCGAIAAVALGSVGESVLKKQDESCRAAGQPGVTITIFPDIAAGTRLVQSGRADYLLGDLAFVNKMVADNPAVYARAFKLLTGLKVGAAVRKADPDLLHAVHDGLLALQAEGKQAKILARYNFDADMQVPAAIVTE